MDNLIDTAKAAVSSVRDAANAGMRELDRKRRIYAIQHEIDDARDTITQVQAAIGQQIVNSYQANPNSVPIVVGSQCGQVVTLHKQIQELEQEIEQVKNETAVGPAMAAAAPPAAAVQPPAPAQAVAPAAPPAVVAPPPALAQAVAPAAPPAVVAPPPAAVQNAAPIPAVKMCAKCGVELKPAAKFCTKCGTKVA